MTTLYVTHDQVEAMEMCDRIAVMNDGPRRTTRVAAEVYDDPANQFVAGFIGSPSMNFMRVRREAAGLTASRGSSDARFRQRRKTSHRGHDDTDPFVLGVRRPALLGSPAPIDGAAKAEVTVTEPMGDEQLLTVQFDGDDREIAVRAPST